jgi:DNA-3-methyladenine glycosylase II
MTAPPAATPLTEETLATAVEELARRDADLAAVLARRGVPPLWARPPGFATLVLMILEQQVSLASAWAAFERLKQRIGTVTPAALLALDDEALRAIGFSRQKMAYTRGLARDLLHGALDLDDLHAMDDHAALAHLIALHGIGPWTASVYLLMALRRPDVFPAGDLGLVVGMQIVKGLPARPAAEQMLALAEPWRPWRAAAARLLWSEYLAHQKAGTLPRAPRRTASPTR